MLRRKTKMISFRVSPDEYHKLHEACAAEGVASVSELARIAMDGIIRRHVSPRPLVDEVADLRQRAETLAGDIERLARDLESELPDTGNGAKRTCAVAD